MSRIRRKCGPAERKHRSEVMKTQKGLAGLFSCKPLDCGICPGFKECKVSNPKVEKVLFG
jgi:hypothetical protein